MEMSPLKTALVTGAARGIGLQVAIELSRRGFHIVLAARNLAAGERARQALPGTCDVIEMDVTSDLSIRLAAARLGDDFSLDVLVNNAGIYPQGDTGILEISRENLNTTLQTNTLGPLSVVQTFLPALRRGNHPRVINISSGYGQLEGLSPDVAGYCLSKLALNGLTLMLAKELDRLEIAVNSVCPGWVRTDMGGPNADRSVEEGADTIVWLAAEAPHGLTGKFFRDREVIPW